MKKFLLMFALTAFLCVFADTTANAAPIVPEKDFDYLWYVTEHPEIMSFGLNGMQDIYNFYVKTGEPCGWHGRSRMESLINKRNFDAAAYAYFNPDVVLAYGSAAPEVLWRHYQQCGQYEDRIALTTDDETNAKICAYYVVDGLIPAGTSEYNKALLIHDWLCANVAYDYENYLNGIIPWESFCLEGVFFNGRAVCQAYAEAFDYMCELAGLDAEFVTGWANGGGHAWNQVKIDGKWYQIDVTWDDPVPDRGYGIVAEYEYFLISPQKMAEDHIYDHPERIKY